MTTNLSVHNLSKSFKNRNHSLQVLRDINFEVQEGEILSIVGPSGCGKTTLLQILGQIQHQTLGTVCLHGKELKVPSSKISYVFQSGGLFNWLNVMKNVAFGIRDGPKSHQERELMVREALKLVQLEQFVDYYPFQLSGGMQQRLALARALVNNPEILLLDEPFHSLDSDLKFFLHDELLKIQRLYHKTIILVSHDMDEVVYLSNRVLALGNKPATVQNIIEITLPPKRTFATRMIPEFHTYKDQILNLYRYG